MKRKYDIFISYRRRDAGDKAEHLKDLLEPFYKGRISFDRENLSGRFNTQLIERIDTVRDFLLVLGRNSLAFAPEDFTPERVRLYRELTSLSEEAFAARIAQVERHTPIDYVRIEIGRALRRADLHIIPVVPERSAEYCFSSLPLPDDIAPIKGYEAVFYSDSPDALFKDVLPKVRKHLASRADVRVDRTLPLLLTGVAAVALGLGLFFYQGSARRARLEQQRRDMMARLETTYRSLGLNFFGNDTLSLAEMGAVAEILDKMQPVVPDSLLVGRYEVTQGQWARIMHQPCAPADSLMPKTGVSYGDCLNFADRLYMLTNIPFELPTEEDWDYAARGGRDVAPTRYAGSDCADSVAWYAGNSGGTSHKCDGALYPNACGLFDMSGNVGEICNSPYDREARDGRQMACKVVRGGNYSSPAGDVAIDARVPLDQNDKGNEKTGFRLIIRLEQ